MTPVNADQPVRSISFPRPGPKRRAVRSRDRAAGTRIVRAGEACLIGALSCVLLPGRAAAQEPVTLRRDGAPGEWLEFEHRKRLVVELPEDLGGHATTETRLRLRQEVDSVGAVAIRFRSALLEVTFKADPAPHELPDLSALQGLGFRYATDRSGRVTWLAVPGSDDDAGLELRDQVQNWLRQLGFPTLPDGRVAVGDEWSDSGRVPAAALGLAVDYELVQERVTRLTSVRTVARATIATLEVRTRWTPDPHAGAAPSPVASLRGTALQMVRFDVGRGRFVGGTGATSLDLVLAPPGGGQYVSVSATGTQSTSLADSGVATRR